MIRFFFKRDPSCLNAFKLMQTRSFFCNVLRMIENFKAVDQVLFYPLSRSLPADILHAVVDMDRARTTVQSQPVPIPKLKGEIIRSGTDFQDHYIGAGTMDRAGRNQKMVMLLRGKSIDILFCRKRICSLLCFAKILFHFFRIDSILQTKIYNCTFCCIQNVVTLVLCISHSVMRADIFCQRMHLQRQILSPDCIKEIKSDRELRTESAIILHTQQLFRLIQDEIHSGDLNSNIREPQVQTVFFRHTVETPGIIVFFRGKTADLFHPLAAPDSRVKIRHQPEGPASDLSEPFADSFGEDQLWIIRDIGIQKPVDLLKYFHLSLIGKPPFDKVSSFYFPERVFIIVLLFEIRHSSAVTKGDLPSCKVTVDQRIRSFYKTCTYTVNKHPS